MVVNMTIQNADNALVQALKTYANCIRLLKFQLKNRILLQMN